MNAKGLDGAFVIMASASNVQRERSLLMSELPTVGVFLLMMR
jgi:hypothetical protein